MGAYRAFLNAHGSGDFIRAITHELIDDHTALSVRELFNERQYICELRMLLGGKLRLDGLNGLF